MIDDNSKAAILARRARFIATAMMSAGVMSCEKTPAEPVVCLSVAVTPAPGPPDAGAPDAGGEPRPCLKVRPHSTVEPCLHHAVPNPAK